MKQSNWWKLPLTIALVVLFGGGAIAYWWLRQTGNRLDSPLAGARKLPDETEAAAYLVLEKSTWQQLEQFGTPEAQTLVRQQLTVWQQDLLEQTQLDFQRDLQPWMGNVMLAGVPVAETQNLELLAIVGIRDKLQALGFANRVKGEENLQIIEQEYRNTTISTLTIPGEEPWNVAVLGDYLAISPNVELVKAAIDTQQGEPSFARREDMGRLLRSSDLDTPLMQLYVTGLEPLRELSGETEAIDLPATTPVGSLSMGVGLTDKGLYARVITSPLPELPVAEVIPMTGSLVERFPQTTVMFMESENLDRTWQQTKAVMQQTPEGNAVLQQMQSGFASIGLDLDRQVFGWMDGSVAWGLIPSDKGILASVGFGSALVIETSDRKTAAQTLETLENLLKGVLPFPLSVESQTLGEVVVTQWKFPTFGLKPETLVGYGWVEEDILVVGIGDPIVEAMVVPAKGSLADNEVFAELASGFSQASGAIAFADLDGILKNVDLRTLQTREIIAPSPLAVLESIRSFGMSVTPAEGNVSMVELWMPLLRATEEVPSPSDPES